MNSDSAAARAVGTPVVSDGANRATNSELGSVVWFGRLPALPHGVRKFAAAGSLGVEGPSHPRETNQERVLGRLGATVHLERDGRKVASGDAELLLTDMRVAGVISEGTSSSGPLQPSHAIGAFTVPWRDGVHVTLRNGSVDGAVELAGASWRMTWDVTERLNAQSQPVGPIANRDVARALARMKADGLGPRADVPTSPPVERNGVGQRATSAPGAGPGPSVAASRTASAQPEAKRPSPRSSGLDEEFNLFEPWTWITLIFTPLGRRILAAVAGAILLVALLVVPKLLEKEPATQANVCNAYRELGQQLLDGNGILGNPLFRKADQLGDLASRYEGNFAVKNDGSALKRIADSSSTSGGELQGATRNIAAMCGAPPLGLNALLGR